MFIKSLACSPLTTCTQLVLRPGLQRQCAGLQWQCAGLHIAAYSLSVECQGGWLLDAYLLIKVLGQHVDLVLIAAALALVPELQLRNHLQASSKLSAHNQYWIDDIKYNQHAACLLSLNSALLHAPPPR